MLFKLLSKYHLLNLQKSDLVMKKPLVTTKPPLIHCCRACKVSLDLVILVFIILLVGLLVLTHEQRMCIESLY